MPKGLGGPSAPGPVVLVQAQLGNARTEQEHPNFHRILQVPALTAGGASSAPPQEAEILFISH